MYTVLMCSKLSDRRISLQLLHNSTDAEVYQHACGGRLLFLIPSFERSTPAGA